MALSNPETNPQGTEPLQIESLYAALDAVRRWFDVYFTFPPAHYIRFSMAISTQLARSLVILYRLTTFDHPGWDRELVRQTCDFAEILNTVTNEMSQVKAAAGLGYDDSSYHVSLFEANIRKLNFIKSWWQAKGSADNPASPTKPPDSVASGSTAMTFPDEIWLNQMLTMEEFTSGPNELQAAGGATNMASFGLSFGL